MAHRPIDHNNDDPGRISDDPSRISSGSSSRMSPTGTPDAKSEGKRKKFRPLDAVRKLFKRRPKLKEIDSARARSTSALYGHASGDGEDEEGGFLSRLSLRKNKSRSEDSVLVESRSNQGGILRKLAYSVEGINRSLYSSNSGKSSSRNSLNSTESQDLFKESFQAQKSAIEPTDASVDFEAVAKTEALNTDAAKFKISVRPKGRKGSRQNRQHRQKVASNLPCLSEELNIITNPSLTEDDTEKPAQDVENEKPVLKPDEKETGFKQQAKLRTGSTNQDLPPKPRPKSTPVIIHSTPEIKEQRLNAVLDLENRESPKHLLNPELLEFGKIRSKSLDIDGRVPKSSDLGLSSVSKFNLAEKVSKDDDGIISAGHSGRKSPEISKTDRRGFQPLDFRRTDLEARTMKFSRSCETDLNIGSRSQKRPLSSNVGDTNVKIIKSPLRSELGLRFKQNPEDEEKVPTPIRSPVKKIDLDFWPTKSPIQTPSLESKPLSPTKSSNLELKSINLTSDLEDETKLTKSLKPFELGLKPVKSPLYGSDNSALNSPKSLQSPVRQTKDLEFSFPKMRTENHDTKDQTNEASELPESVQKLGENPEQEKSLQERRLENSDHSSVEETPTTDKVNDKKKTLQLPASNNETAEQTKSPRKIIANLELNNLSTKPFRSFSDPKSPRSALRSGNLSPKSPMLSPRSPVLPPKPIRSPIENLDIKSTPKDSDGSKLGLKRDNISNSSENLFSKLPPSPSVPPKSFRSGQKMGPRSALHSPKSEDMSENPFLKSVNLELKSEISSDPTEELPSKLVQLEPKPLKKAEDVVTVKKPSEKPNLRPKPLKSYSEMSSSDSKLNFTSTKAERSYAKPNDGQVDVEQRHSQVGKNREIFQALGYKESKVPVTPKKAAGSSKMSAFVNKTESFKSTPTDENPADIEKQNISQSVTQNKSKTPDFVKSPDSLSTTPKVMNVSKTDSIPDLNRKPKTAFGGYKTEESRKTVPASSKPSFSSKAAVETPKTIESSATLSQRADTGPNLPSTARSVDTRKLSDPPKAIVTPKKLPSSSKHSDETSNETNRVATTSKTTSIKTSTKEATDPKKPSKPCELTSAASTENVATGIDVSTNNTNRLSALFEARSVTASHVEPPGTTVKIEVVAKDDFEEQQPVTLREKGKSSEKISELSSRQSKVLDLVKNFQKLQAT